MNISIQQVLKYIKYLNIPDLGDYTFSITFESEYK